MAALAADRNTPRREGAFIRVPVAAGAKIYAGSLVARPAGGNAEPGKTATGLVALGRAEEIADNSSGADGAIHVRIRRGTFRWENSGGGDEIAATNIGGDAYIVDDQTVAATNGTNTRSQAGRILGVDAKGVWVETR